MAEAVEQEVEGLLDVLPIVDEPPTRAEAEVSEVNEAIHKERHEAERASKKPFIDHLDDAVITGEDGDLVFVPKCHEKVVIERHVSFGENLMWLDTRVYEVREVDTVTGNVTLYDPDMCQHAMTNYITGTERSYRFKIPGKRQRLTRKRPTKGKTAPKEKKVKRLGGIRRIYDTRGVIHTRLKGIAFVPEGETKAEAADRLQVLPQGPEKVTITHPDDGWTETWYIKKGM